MNFILRPWTTEDLDSLVKFANNFNISKNLTDAFPYPYTIENGRAFIEMATENTPRNVLAIEINGQASGGIGVHPQKDVYRKNFELGYWLAEPYWGQGIISKAIVQMVDYAFTNFDMYRIYARPFGHNVASQKALEKAGFILEARFEKTFFKNGAYVDELIYAVRRDKWNRLQNRN